MDALFVALARMSKSSVFKKEASSFSMPWDKDISIMRYWEISN